jgi:glutamate dehydrogenase
VPDLERKKTELVQKAEALAGEMLDAMEWATAKRVIYEFYRHVPPTDVAERSPRDLCGAALSLWRFAERRRTGQAKVRVHNPEPAEDGWASSHTIVEIVNDDMPFLVDSISAAINASNRVINVIIYPILTVARHADGGLSEIRDASAVGLRESWIQVEITPESDLALLAHLAQTLAAVLADVRAVVEDWQPLRQALHKVLDELAGQPPPPVPAAELGEVQDFLRWLDHDNFTFLGYRDYLFDGTAEPAHSALGILRDEAHSVFGGLRGLSSLPPDVQDFIRRRELLLVTKSNRRATVHRTAHMDAIGLRRFDLHGEVVGIRLFLGLFTSEVYSRDPRSIPLLRLKVRDVFQRAGFSPTSHNGKVLLRILETFPRDELLQTDEDQLFDTIIGILNLRGRLRIAVFIRRDALERFVSCLVYVPRERYDAALRNRFASILEEAFAGQVSAFYTQLDESALARIHFIIRTSRGAVPTVDAAVLEERLAEAGRNWMDRLQEAAAAAFGDEGARLRLSRCQSLPNCLSSEDGCRPGRC